MLPTSLARTRHRLALAEASLVHRRPDPLHLRERASVLARRLSQAARHQTSRRHQRWALLAARLAGQDPAQPLARGFAIVTDRRGEIVRDPAGLLTDQRLDIRLARGTAHVRVVKGEPARLPGMEPDDPA